MGGEKSRAILQPMPRPSNAARASLVSVEMPCLAQRLIGLYCAGGWADLPRMCTGWRSGHASVLWLPEEVDRDE